MRRYSANSGALSGPGGRAGATAGVDRLRALPGFHSMEKMPEIGATIDEPWLCTGQAGMAYFLHQDRQVLADSLAKLHRLEDERELHRIRPHFEASCRAG